MRGNVRRFGYLLAAAMCLSSVTVQAAGLHLIEVPANETDRAQTGAVWYPCSAPTQDIAIESRVITAAKDCSIVGNKLSLIVVSHGRAGWFGGHYSTAAAIADAGFVVAAISHPGDNTTDKSRVDDLSVLAERPADVRRLVDFMLASYVDAPKLDKERIGFLPRSPIHRSEEAGRGRYSRFRAI